MPDPRRYVIILDDPGDEEKLTVEVQRIEYPVDPAPDPFELWEQEKKPVLMCRLEIPSLRELPGPPDQKAEALIRHYPDFDAFMLHHFNKTDVEATVAAIRARGKMVYRVLNCSDVRESGRGEPQGNWNRVRMDAMDRFDIGLRDELGNHLHYRWWGRGIMMDWSKVWQQKKAMDYLVACQGFLLSPQQFGGFWQLDTAYPYLSQWMLLEGADAVERGEYELLPRQKSVTQERLNGLYIQGDYAAGLNEFTRRIVTGVIPNRRVFWNGDKDTDHFRMWEAMNKRGAGEFEDRLELWADRFGNVMELRTPGRSDSPRVAFNARTGIELWAKEGGFLWPDNTFHVGHPSYPLGEVTPIQRLAIDARKKVTG